DTGQPQLAAPDLQATSDNGSSNTDNITNALNPVFAGGGAEAGVKVHLYAGGVEVGNAVADASGNWSVTHTAAATGVDIAYTVTQE
ncbi:Ig-like domain-containing protein, partial [Pseudoduganella ginsengisoli]|uniref:Ig-like domain-containing protein n=1 Tax=Pseudoduganella ginsengisoli TaxID=1462440 RepID=UPI001478A842